MNVSGNGDITIEISASSQSAAESISRLSNALKDLKSSVKGTGMEKVSQQLASLSSALSSLGGSANGLDSVSKVFDGLSKLNGVKISKSLGEDLISISTALSQFAVAAENSESVMQIFDRLAQVGEVKIPKSLGENLSQIATSVENVSPQTIANLEKMTDALSKLSGVDLKGFSGISGARQIAETADQTGRADARAQIAAETAGSGDLMEMDALKYEQSLDRIDKAIERTQSKIAMFKQAMEAEQMSDGGGDAEKIENFNAAIDEQTQILDALIQKREELKSGSSSEAKIKVNTSDVDKASKKISRLSKLMQQFKRVALYRVIRSALRFVTEGFKEGLENAYQFSKTINGDLAKSLDNISSSVFKMKNQLGAALGQVLVATYPILMKLIEIVTYAANAVTEFFAVLSGQSTYLRAIDYWKEWGDAADDAGGKAKTALKYLAPFDELNVLPSEKSSGSGSGKDALDYDKMFEVAEVEDLWKKIGGIFKEFYLEVKDVLFNWDDLSAEDIFKKFLAGLGGIIGFSLGGVPGAIVGVLAGVGIGMLIEKVWPNVKNLSKEQLFPIFLGAIGGAIGFALGGAPGAVIGTIAGVGIGLLIENIFPEVSDKLDAKTALGIVGGALVAAKILRKIGGAGAAAAASGGSAGLAGASGAFGYVLAGALTVGVGWNLVNFIQDISKDPVKALEKEIQDPVVQFGGNLGAKIAELFDSDIFKYWKDSPFNTTDGKTKVVYELDGAGVSVKTFVDIETGKKVGFISPDGKKYWLKDGVWQEVIEDIAGTTANINISVNPVAKITKAAKGLAGLIAQTLESGKRKLALEANAKFNADVDFKSGGASFTSEDWGHVDPSTGEWVMPAKMEIAPEFSSNAISEVEYKAKETNVKIKEALLGRDGIASQLGQNISNALNLAFKPFEQKKLGVNAEVRSVDKSKLTAKDLMLQAIASFTGTDKSKLTVKDLALMAIAKFTKTDKSNLTENQKKISVIGNFFKTIKGNLTEKMKTISSIAKFGKTDKSGLTDAQKTIKTIASLFKFTVTAETPVVSVTGKIDKIIQPGSGTIEIKKNGGVFANGRWNPITAYAGGGYPMGGELFLAREAGPELVGRMGNHTAVMNNNQIVASVSDGVAVANEAVVGAVFAAAAQIVRAIQERGGASGGESNFDTLARAVTRWQRSAAMADGNY